MKIVHLLQERVNSWCNAYGRFDKTEELIGTLLFLIYKDASSFVKGIVTPVDDGFSPYIETVLYCKEKGIGAYQGGTCNETDPSAQVCVHCAMATQPVQIFAKPMSHKDWSYCDERNYK